MPTIDESIEVDVPISTAYNQWTQFEDFPAFMGGVEQVRQLDDTLTHWRTSIGGVEREFDAQIVEQTPDTRVAWQSIDGTTHVGQVTFEPISATQTRVHVQTAWEPETLVEKAGAAIGADDRQVKADLKRFKEFIESRGVETGAWRGEV
ncbi:SRPBCC family protein [Cellulomonas palmilytica]|uniref:SRPBCC family protein n=1 Tax=Cellulomonas palmilytica TaxID=2608402 RepID=UPI001F314D05|nr:SRPBCC family protein [Cellulomonas palmilytica]UJP40342.1 SRPBCC family protein [Cellulomonas palmilytica]